MTDSFSSSVIYRTWDNPDEIDKYLAQYTLPQLKELNRQFGFKINRSRDSLIETLENLILTRNGFNKTDFDVVNCHRYSVSELKEHLKILGLCITGNKNALCLRIKTYYGEI